MTDPVRRGVTVASDVEETFRLFTEDIAAWWPSETHSMAAYRDDGTTVRELVFETRQGGRIYEIASDGTEGTWATVTAWDPPRRVVLAWKPNLRDEPPTEVEVTFSSVDGGTRVDLEHRCWERLGARAEPLAEAYGPGWAHILEDRFAAATVTIGEGAAE